MLIGLIKTLDEFVAEGSGTSVRGPYKPYFETACEHNNLLNVNVHISYFAMLIGLIKSLDEFDDEGSGTPVRALKTLTLKNLVKTITF